LNLHVIHSSTLSSRLLIIHLFPGLLISLSALAFASEELLIDCDSVLNEIERAVCASPTVSNLNAILHGLIENTPSLDVDEKSNFEECESKLACLVMAYEKSIFSYFQPRESNSFHLED